MADYQRSPISTDLSAFAFAIRPFHQNHPSYTPSLHLPSPPASPAASSPSPHLSTLPASPHHTIPRPTIPTHHHGHRKHTSPSLPLLRRSLIQTILLRCQTLHTTTLSHATATNTSQQSKDETQHCYDKIKVLACKARQLAEDGAVCVEFEVEVRRDCEAWCRLADSGAGRGDGVELGRKREIMDRRNVARVLGGDGNAIANAIAMPARTRGSGKRTRDSTHSVAGSWAVASTPAVSEDGEVRDTACASPTASCESSLGFAACDTAAFDAYADLTAENVDRVALGWE